MPVFILHGDSFLTTEALEELRVRVGPPELLASNCHSLSGEGTTLDALRAICNALPFLARNRLVVVEGLLSSFENQYARGRGRRKPTSHLNVWEGLESYVGEMAPTTLLAFVDGPLRKNNPMLSLLRSKAQIQSYTAPRGEELARWTRNRVEMKGAGISVGALRLLGQYVGANLRVLDAELEKLSLYAGDQPIKEDHVRELVPQVRESSIFTAVDAILEGRSSVAVPLLHRLRTEGASLSYIQSMVARQLRVVTLAKDLLERGVAQSVMSEKLEIRAEFAVRKTLDQARKFSWIRLKTLYQRLLEMDLAVKEGRLDEDLALEMLVAEVAAVR